MHHPSARLRRHSLFIALLLGCLLVGMSLPSLRAQSDEAPPSETVLSAVVGFVSEESQTELLGVPQVHQKLEVVVKS
ncbi:MAG: hypothetical protein ACYC5M_18640, partial [Anaerolineae bacterium]